MGKYIFRPVEYIFFIVVLVCFYILNRYSSLMGDDFWYKFMKGATDEYVNIPSFMDALHTQMQAYMTWNGRLIVHTLVSYFCGVLGMDIFVVLNSVVFVLLYMGILIILRQNLNVRMVADKYVVLLLLFVLFPSPGEVFFGSIAMSINYLWAACAVVYFMILYNYVKNTSNEYHLIKKLLLFFVALIVGSLQESFTIGISGAFFIYYCFHIKDFKKNIPWLVIGFWIGTCLVVLAPGNFVRMGGVVDNYSGIIKYVRHFGVAIYESKILLLLFILSFYTFFKYRKILHDYFRTNNIYCLAIVFNLLVCAVVYSGPRQLTSVELFSLILFVGLLYTIYPRIDKYRKPIMISAIVILAVIFVPIYKARKLNYEAYNNLIKSKVVDNVLVNNNYMKVMDYLQSCYFVNKYVYRLEIQDWVYSGLSIFMSDGKNPNYIAAILPSTPDIVVEKFKKYGKNGIYHDTEDDYFLIERNLNDPIYKLETLSESSTIMGYVKNLIMKKDNINRLNVSMFLGHFDYDAKRYYVIYEREYEILRFLINK